MPPPVSKRQRVILIDEEWASTLIGLPMQVPNSWWNGYNKDNKTLNVGTIVGVDFDAPQSSYFQLECVGEIYAMPATHPSHLRDMDRVEGHQTGIKICSDRKKYVELSPIKPTLSLTRRSELTQQKKKQPWRCHQSLSAATRGRCSWARCPGINKSKAKRKRAYDTFMRCEECTANAGCNIYLCNDTKNGKVVSCHVAYHKRNHNRTFLLVKRVGG